MKKTYRQIMRYQQRLKENNAVELIEIKEIELPKAEDVKFSKKSVMEQLSSEQRETIILDQMITLMEDYSSLEENLTGSTFVDLKNAMEKLNGVRKEANKSTEDVESSYDPFTQLDYMENAMSGARLKAFSVNRDTFNSIANKGQARLGKGYKINVLYPVEGSAGAYQRKLYDRIPYILLRRCRRGGHKSGCPRSCPEGKRRRPCP